LAALGRLGGSIFIAVGPRSLAGRIRCPGCGSWVVLDTERCPTCGRAIASDMLLWSDPGAAMSPAAEVTGDPAFQALGATILATAAATAFLIGLWPTVAAVLALDAMYTSLRLRRLRR
ncbi:MAG: hypothetical protein L0Z54_00660, partial [Thermoplasmata archaeon]|nr:hypothetical protein [Thermoplasmata archaeon]